MLLARRTKVGCTPLETPVTSADINGKESVIATDHVVGGDALGIDLDAVVEDFAHDAVAAIRDTASASAAAESAGKPRTARPGRAALMLSRATGLCEKLDAALTRLGTAEFSVLPADDVAKPRQRVALLARRTDA